MNLSSLSLVTDKIVIKSAQDVYNTVILPTTEQECFIVLLLNTKNVLLEQYIAHIGTLNSCPIHPREVFKEAIRNNAAAIILVHNHPSGDPTPSPEDYHVTEKMKEAGTLLQINVLDHVIIGDKTYFSFQENRGV